ncbi:histidine kinase [Bifidobacterium ramosum]|uniref:histidine kinase n=1 Tax=Bifidobacterium ramosum TaxID=1798158 RepID=UPI0013D223A0|nr:histidine kinase [Bifidobacterium ramosum]
MAIVVELIVRPPQSPAQMIVALACLAFAAAIPVIPRASRVIALIVCIVALPCLTLPDLLAAGDVVSFTALLALGYLLPRWGAVAVTVGYAVLDAAGFVLLHTGSIGGSVVRGMIDGIGEIEANDAAASGTAGTMDLTGVTGARTDIAAVLPQYSLIVFVFTVALNLMGIGFLVMFGSAFRRTAEANERAARSERLLGRVTREQELAHMIHDSVANDMSTIAMLAWRAKAAGAGDAGAGDVDEMLDAIYERSHHALDRVHEVIDVLNGKRELGEAGAGQNGTDLVDGTVDGLVRGGRSFDVQLEKYVEDQDRVMAMLGLRGVTRLNVASDVVVPVAVRRVVMGLIEEIYANIVRHGVAVSAVDGDISANGEAAYTLHIAVDGRGVRINEVNALAVDDAKTLAYGHGRGNGIRVHRAAIEALGGALHAGAQDGAWMVGAEIPLD